MATLPKLSFATTVVLKATPVVSLLAAGVTVKNVAAPGMTATLVVADVIGLLAALSLTVSVQGPPATLSSVTRKLPTPPVSEADAGLTEKLPAGALLASETDPVNRVGALLASSA